MSASYTSQWSVLSVIVGSPPRPSTAGRGTEKYGLSRTSTGLYRSCPALASFSGTFDLILFQAFNFEFIVKKVFGLDRRFEKTENKRFLVCFD